jgi:hypothetical protein
MFDQPVSLVSSPDRAWWFVAERRGRVWRIAANDEQAEPELVLDISERVNASSAAIGLLAIAAHPTTGSLFVSYTGFGGTVATSRISRFTRSNAGSRLDPSHEERLVEIDQISDYHVNADLRFGPDGYLSRGSAMRSPKRSAP